VERINAAQDEYYGTSTTTVISKPVRKKIIHIGYVISAAKKKTGCGAGRQGENGTIGGKAENGKVVTGRDYFCCWWSNE